MDEDKAPEKMSQEAYFDTAIRAVRQKKPAPEIDFTLHTMEDGSQVSTTERVCKGMALHNGLRSSATFPNILDHFLT